MRCSPGSPVGWRVGRGCARTSRRSSSTSATITWADYDEQVDRWAAGLRALGVERGDRVGLYMRNRPEFLYVFFATARLGAIVVPVNHFLSPREVTYTLEHSGATVVVTDGEFDDVDRRRSRRTSPVEHWVHDRCPR